MESTTSTKRSETRIEQYARLAIQCINEGRADMAAWHARMAAEVALREMRKVDQLCAYLRGAASF